MELRTRVVFFHTPLSLNPISWLSMIIRWFTGAYYNHVGITHVVNGQEVLTEANEKGVTVSLASERIRTTPSQLLFITVEIKNPDKLIEIWGRGYGEMTLLKYAFAIIKGTKLRDKKSRTGKTFVCSHVVAYALEMEDWWQVDPKTLYDRLTVDK